jgi:hypothetical protein
VRSWTATRSIILPGWSRSRLAPQSSTRSQSPAASPSCGARPVHTCVWIGRYSEIYAHGDEAARLLGRPSVKLHHCGQRKAKDANITQALIDRFAPGEPNRGKGTKAAPGWFHGFAADMWQAYAVAVVLADQIEGREGVA